MLTALSSTLYSALRPLQHDYPSSQPPYSSTSSVLVHLDQLVHPLTCDSHSFLKSKALKLWPHDQTTPKPDSRSGRLHHEVNPFDAAIAASSVRAPSSPTASPTTPTPTTITTPQVTSSTPKDAFSGFTPPSPVSTSLGPSTPRHSPGPHVGGGNVHHKLLSSQLPSLSLPSRSKTPSPSHSPGGPNRSSPATTAISSTTATATAASVNTTRASPPASIILPPRQTITTSKEPMSPRVSSNPTLAPPTIKPPLLRRMHTAQPSTSTTTSPSTHHGGPSRGQLHVKVLQARNLNVSSHLSRPYVVVQFEQSEFVSREPIASESEKEVKGKAGPLSRTSSALALPSLSAAAAGLSGGISRAFESIPRKSRIAPTSAATPPGAIASSHSSSSSSDEGSGGGAHSGSARPSKTATPRAHPDSGAATPGGGLFGVMSPHNPVWKHEVSL